MKSIALFLAVILFAPGLHAQEKKPWEIDRLCGRLEHVQKIPDRKNANTFSEKRKALREVPLGLYERRENQTCCEGMNAVETTQTIKGGRFEFKTKKPGDFWMATNWNGKQYKLAVVYKPGKNSTTTCSQQGIALDDEGNAVVGNNNRGLNDSRASKAARLPGVPQCEMKITLSSRAKKIGREADDLRSRGTCCLFASSVLLANSRSLHAPVDRHSRSTGLVGMTVLGWLLMLVTGSARAHAADPISIQLAHHTPREMETAQTLKQALNSYDLKKYTFTREVVIEERSMNHAFPVLTLNVRFADSPDELLSSYVHEQLHWYLREHDAQQKAAIAELRQMYPNVPVGLPEGADSAYSTYGHLVDCYLEIEADRELIGPKRTEEVIKNKPWYTWIYKTILRDEDKIRGVVQEHNLEFK